MIGWIVFTIWFLSLVVGVISGVIYFENKDELAQMIFVISLIICLGVPFLIFAFTILVGAEWIGQIFEQVLEKVVPK